MSHPAFRTASDFINCLPLSKHLSQNQQTLVLLEREWRKLVSLLGHHNAPPTKLYVNPKLDTTILGNYNNGTLTVVCQDALIAGKIRHQQDKLIDALNHYIDRLNSDKYDQQTSVKNREYIETLTRHRINKLLININPGAEKIHMPYVTVSSKPSAPLSNKAIDAIENCHQHSKNNALRQALDRLVTTLRKRNNEQSF